MLRLTFVLFFQVFILNQSFCQDPRRFQAEIDLIKNDSRDYAVVDDLILITGSSSARMWTDVAADFPGLNVVNRGFGGSHMSDLLFYADTVIVQCRPSLIFIYEGDNDIAAGKKPDEILDSGGRLADLIRQKLPEAIICFISAKPSLARWNLKDSYVSFNTKLKEFTWNRSNVYFLDIWKNMIDDQGSPREDIFLEDGLHMNRKGYDIWKAAVDEFLTLRGIRGIQFGVCTSLANSEMLKKTGYAYVEGSVGRDLMPGKPDEEFTGKMKEFDTCRLPVIACNGFLPGTLKVTGQDARPDTALRYAEVAFRRAATAGIRTIVFGSSGARSVPDGFEREQARQQFISLLKDMGPVARKYGVTIAIENLQKSETNFINTVGEALAIAREVNDPNIRILADLFHMMRENEGPEVLVEAGNYLVHCHIAELKSRTAPGMEGDNFRPYFSALKKIRYRGGISIEGSWKPGDLPGALQVMKEQWETTE